MAAPFCSLGQPVRCRTIFTGPAAATCISVLCATSASSPSSSSRKTVGAASGVST